jgi:hypothetical protein
MAGRGGMMHTKLEASGVWLNRNQLAITGVAYNPRRDEIVVCDGRTLRAFSHRAAQRSSRVELTLPQKDMVGTHVFYNGIENQYVLVLQGLEVMIISVDLQVVGRANTEQVSILTLTLTRTLTLNLTLTLTLTLTVRRSR